MMRKFFNWLLALVARDVATSAVTQVGKIADKLTVHAVTKLDAADQAQLKAAAEAARELAAREAAAQALKVADKLRELVK